MHKSKYSNAYKKKDEFENPKTEEESAALLNNLKVEYYKLQNELDNLIEKYYNLKNHVDLEEDEENKDIIFEEKNKNNDRKKKRNKITTTYLFRTFRYGCFSWILFILIFLSIQAYIYFYFFLQK